MTTIDIKGKAIEIDEEGYLVNYLDWSHEVAKALSEESGLKLTKDHWPVLELIREEYATTQVVPTARDFLKVMETKMGKEKGTQQYFNVLFPHESLKQCGRIAGLPQLSGCM